MGEPEQKRENKIQMLCMLRVGGTKPEIAYVLLLLLDNKVVVHLECRYRLTMQKVTFSSDIVIFGWNDCSVLRVNCCHAIKKQFKYEFYLTTSSSRMSQSQTCNRGR